MSDAKRPNIKSKRNKTNSAPNLEWRGLPRDKIAPWRSTKGTIPLPGLGLALTKTGRPRKRMNTQQREQRNAARARNKAERAAKSEHERRSEAARKGWAKLSKAERSARALKGWDTRDRQHGRTAKRRQDQRYLDEQIRLESERVYGSRRRPVSSNPFSHLPRGDGQPW